ncbi:MAG: hypothetical protein A3J27_02355 [Candidatus Tectomicrobia bacterium RIFCSPLOWO2_12_FULL_69_37]|nr:MAG: hypothetical protein A3J27_02355 [Candidatus Tectomicrobia bacterium RIFCSPLOWO2_12_FULL_69_37]
MNLAVVRRELAKVYVQVAAAVASRLVHQAEQMKLGRVEAFRWETPQERFQKLEFIRTEEQAVRRLEREARQEAQPQVRASVREWPSARGDWGHAPIRIQKGPAFSQLERINRSGWGRF